MLVVYILLGLCGIALMAFIGTIIFIIGEQEDWWG